VTNWNLIWFQYSTAHNISTSIFQYLIWKTSLWICQMANKTLISEWNIFLITIKNINFVDIFLHSLDCCWSCQNGKIGKFIHNVFLCIFTNLRGSFFPKKNFNIFLLLGIFCFWGCLIRVDEGLFSHSFYKYNG
jgi:hypothetical protein